MIGRGAIGHPWIFKEIKENRTITNEEKKEVIIEHFKAMVEWYGDYGVILFRKHLHTYSKGYKGASEFRVKVNKIENPNDMLDIINQFF